MSTIDRMILTGLVVVGAGAISAWGANMVYLNNGRTMPAANIEWREGTQEYVVTSGETTVPIPLAQVDHVVVDKPAELDQAAAMVKSRVFGPAIPLLEGVVKKYRMLNWDADAVILLAQAYLETKDIKKAAAAMDNVYALGRDKVPVDLQMLYWRTLLATPGSEAALRKALDLAIGTSGPDIVSAAYLLRGNMLIKQGEEDSALSDFLKVVTIYPNMKAQQPEALFRAAELLDKARDARGSDLRKKLVQEYPGNEFAVKAAAMPKLSGPIAKPAVQPVKKN